MTLVSEDGYVEFLATRRAIHDQHDDQAGKPLRRRLRNEQPTNVPGVNYMLLQA